MRNYPKRKNQMNQKKMELAFIKALRHILSDKYKYILLADRGFGNDRFIEYCTQNGFDIMIRLQPNMTIKANNKQGIMEGVLSEDGIYNCYFNNWKKTYNVIKSTRENESWYIVTNANKDRGIELKDAYKNRFSIERVFLNLKSAGFEIEKSKIKKYDRFKRMLVLCCFSYCIITLLGKFVNENLPAIKKKSPMLTSLLIACSKLEYLQSNYTQKQHLKSLNPS
jgi:transposase